MVIVSASVLLFVYAAFRPNFASAEWTLNGLMATGVGTAFLCLYFTVVSTLFSRDNLRHQLRGASAGQVARRLTAPWIATGVIGLFAAVWALAGYRQAYAGMAVPWVGLVGLFLAITAYAVRDGMFLQWMISQRVKLPVLKGAVLLVCYYVGSGVLAATLVGPERMGQMLRWLTPISGDPTHLGGCQRGAGDGDVGASSGNCWAAGEWGVPQDATQQCECGTAGECLTSE